jgi:hypothetical protein
MLLRAYAIANRNELVVRQLVRARIDRIVPPGRGYAQPVPVCVSVRACMRVRVCAWLGVPGGVLRAPVPFRVRARACGVHVWVCACVRACVNVRVRGLCVGLGVFTGLRAGVRAWVSCLPTNDPRAGGRAPELH